MQTFDTLLEGNWDVQPSLQDVNAACAQTAEAEQHQE